MPRMLAALALLLGLAPIARAQDMPLSQILIEGEGWKKAEGKQQKPKPQESRVPPTGYPVNDYWFSSYSVPVGDGKEQWVNPPLRPLRASPDFKPWDTFVPSIAVLDYTGTLFVGPKEGRHIWIWPSGKGTTKIAGQQVDVSKVAFPFCALRVPAGKQMLAVTGLAADADGRIYAATEIGVQVFDPIGRLCGVMTPAAPGTPERMTFEGDQLTMWIGDVKYTRKLNATGAK